MIVTSFGPQFPFIHGAPPSLGLDPILRRKMLGEQTMGIGVGTEERQTASLAHGNNQASHHERLPEVGVVKNVPDRAFPLHTGNPPIQTDLVARSVGE